MYYLFLLGAARVLSGVSVVGSAVGRLLYQIPCSGSM